MMQNSKQLSNQKLRKLGVGAASVMIGLTMIGLANADNTAHADSNSTTIPVAAKPVVATNTSENTTSNNNAANTATTQSTNNNQTIKPATTGNNAGTSKQAQASQAAPAIISNPAYDNQSTTPTVTDGGIAHGVYVSTPDSSVRTPFSGTNNSGQTEQAIVNPAKSSTMDAHGVIVNNSNETKHVDAVYFLPLERNHESMSEVYKDITLDSSHFDPRKGLTVNGGTNVMISYSLGNGVYKNINQLPNDFDWSKVIYVKVDADLAAG